MANLFCVRIRKSTTSEKLCPVLYNDFAVAEICTFSSSSLDTESVYACTQRGVEDADSGAAAADMCRGLLPTLIERIDSMYEDESIAVLQLFACVVEMHDKQVCFLHVHMNETEILYAQIRNLGIVLGLMR